MQKFGFILKWEKQIAEKGSFDMSELKYKRVLLKVSGEALAGSASRGLDFEVIDKVCDVIAQCNKEGVEVGIVVGGGNFWRGLKDGKGMHERTRADHMGMLATTINCLGAGRYSGAEGRAASGCRPPSRCDLSLSRTSAPGPSGIWRRAEWSSSAAAPEIPSSPPTRRRCSARRRSTRTSSCWPRTSTACTAPTPRLDPSAVKYDTISYDDVLAQHLQVMDSTATSLSMDNNIPVILFALEDPENILRVVHGEKIGTIVKD